MTELYCYPIPFDHYDRNIALLNKGLNKWKLNINSERIQEQYVTDYINQKVANEAFKCPFLEISENIFECEGIGLELRQVRVFPSIHDWTNLPSNVYENYLTHQSQLFKSYHSGSASGMKEIPAFKSRRRFLNFGKHVKFLSWCPKLSSENQVLVGVSTNDSVDQAFDLEIEPERNLDLIQVWEYANLWERSDEPRLAYAFVHNWGHIVDATWVSADEINMDRVHNSPYITDMRQALHGHMLFCCTDGYVRIIPIPKFAERELCQLLQSVPESCEFPILEMNPNIELKLGLGGLFMNDDRETFGYPTCVDWKSKYINKVVVGFSKGYVGVYDLSVVHHMRYDSVNHYLTPIFKRRVSYASVISVCFSSFEWKTFNVSVAANSYPQTNFIMKMTSKSPPSDVLKLKEAPKTVHWTYNSDIFVCVPANSDSIKILSLLCQSVTTIPISKINCVSYCDSLNTLIIGTQSGSVITLSLNHRSIMQSILDIGTSHDLHDLVKNIRHYRTVHRMNLNNNLQMLVDCETQSDVLQLYDDAPSVSYPNITHISVNPNVTGSGFAAVVFDNGIVHLMHFCDLELSSLMRDISILSMESEEQNTTVMPPVLPMRDKKAKKIICRLDDDMSTYEPSFMMAPSTPNPTPSVASVAQQQSQQSQQPSQSHQKYLTGESLSPNMLRRGRKPKTLFMPKDDYYVDTSNAPGNAANSNATDTNNNAAGSGVRSRRLDDIEQFDKLMEADRQEREREAAAAMYPLQHLENSGGQSNSASNANVRISSNTQQQQGAYRNLSTKPTAPMYYNGASNEDYLNIDYLVSDQQQQPQHLQHHQPHHKIVKIQPTITTGGQSIATTTSAAPMNYQQQQVLRQTGGNQQYNTPIRVIKAYNSGGGDSKQPIIIRSSTSKNIMNQKNPIKIISQTTGGSSSASNQYRQPTIIYTSRTSNTAAAGSTNQPIIRQITTPMQQQQQQHRIQAQQQSNTTAIRAVSTTTPVVTGGGDSSASAGPGGMMHHHHHHQGDEGVGEIHEEVVVGTTEQEHAMNMDDGGLEMNTVEVRTMEDN